MNVRAEGEAIDIEAFRNLVVAYKERRPVRLKDVAVVEDGLEDRRRVGRAMGQPVGRHRDHASCAAPTRSRSGDADQRQDRGAAQATCPRA